MKGRIQNSEARMEETSNIEHSTPNVEVPVMCHRDEGPVIRIKSGDIWLLDSVFTAEAPRCREIQAQMNADSCWLKTEDLKLPNSDS